MTCITIDDEPLAAEVIKRFATKVPFLDLKACFQSAVEALLYLQETPVDLIFLDIQMPDLTGIELVQNLTKRPMIIFTTAYADYAIKSYELNAVDYLLKPILFARFLKAVNKAYASLPKESQNKELTKENGKSDFVRDNNQENPFIFVKSDTRIFKISLSDIYYLESMRDYIGIHTEEHGLIMTLSSMDKMLQKLNPEQFIRIHRSYTINISHISMIQHHQVHVKNKELSIGSKYRQAFYERLGM